MKVSILPSDLTRIKKEIAKLEEDYRNAPFSCSDWDYGYLLGLKKVVSLIKNQ